MRKIIKVLFALIVLTLALAALSGCHCWGSEHEGGEATCTEAAVCTKCGESYGEPLGHTGGEATCDSAAVCTRCNKSYIAPLGHDMADATCTEPSSCKREGCNYTEGKALRHNPTRATCTEPSICTRCNEVLILALGHRGGEATCAAAAVCDTCGESYGEKLPHHNVYYYADEYYCDKEGLSAGSSCGDCGEVIRKRFPLAPLGHDMVDATCTEAAHCQRVGCDYTEGEALGHTGYSADFLCDTCNRMIEPEADSVITIEQANALAALVSTTLKKYYVTGTVKNVANTFNGNIYITDGTNTFYIYGTKSADGSVPYNNFETPVYAGDTVTMYGYISRYDGTAQMKDAWMISCTHEHIYSEATCQKVATCVCGLTQGDIGDHDYKDGMCTVCNAIDPDYEGEITVTVGKADFNTIPNASTAYATYTTTDGWTTIQCCVLKGGASDANPAFIFIGEDTTRAITLNGNTTKVGSLTSPTLTGGISKLSFKYGHAYSDKNGVDITINIKQNGAVVASYHLDKDDVTQKTAYEFAWILEEEITGDFVIEITNNSPSNASSGNKDRVSIWDLEWLSN